MNEKFARGRSSEAFKVEGNKVLKLFFEDYPEEYAKKEFKNTKVAYETGCTKMKVYEMVKQDNRNGIIMDYIDGISQNDMPTKNPLYIFKGGKDLARCHQRVHSKKSHDLVDVREMVCEMLEEETLNVLTNEEKDKVKKYVMSLPEDDTIIHLDFHTGNVLVDGNGECTVIDWMTAARGNRAVEVAMMEFLFSEAELFPGSSKLQLVFYSGVRGMIGKQYFKLYQQLMPISSEEIDKYRILALIIRRSWGIEFERENLTNKIKNLIKKYC
ncbi:MAG: phosphotransferase [Firmicutes bacterium]|nr:phosphotransferase [Candidatus Colivicinus equi]